MARLLGIPHFLTESSVDETREDNRLLRRAKKCDDDGLEVQKVNVAAARRIRQQFSGYVIRRTKDSLDWKGEKLLNLPPHKEIVGVLTLTERETTILDQRAQDAKAK